MSAEVIVLEGNTVPNLTSDFAVAVARPMKTIICKAAGTKWRLLLRVAVGILLTVVAMKLMALLGAAFDISFLRDVGGNGTPWAPVGGAGAGLGAGAAGGGGDGGGGSGGGAGGGGMPPLPPDLWGRLKIGIPIIWSQFWNPATWGMEGQPWKLLNSKPIGATDGPGSTLGASY